MSRVLVTGATGLIGANICRLLRQRDTEVRALVRPGSEYEILQRMGVTLAFGDITEADDITEAARDVDAIINAAAVLGGPEQDLDQQLTANHQGALYCYDAARDGGRRVIELTTTPFFRTDVTLTEFAELRPEEEILHDPYALSKGRAFRDGRQRAEAGEDICFVIPGGTFGPSPIMHRSLAPTSFNALIRGAVRGRLREFATFPIPWVRAEDVAAAVVATLDVGSPGVAYIAFGPDQPTSTAAFLTLACQIAGVPHVVAEVAVDADDPAAKERYGATMFALATQRFPDPQFDNARTRHDLGYAPMPIADALAETIDWLRAAGKLD